jgi:hydroxylamine reductase (hybrid-cluster protein)
MTIDVRLSARYAPSHDVVARDIEGELIIVPLAAGIGDLEDELFTVNDTGRAIWNHLDGKQTLQEIIASLCSEFDASPDEITQDVTGFTTELLKRRMLIDVSA